MNSGNRRGSHAPQAERPQTLVESGGVFRCVVTLLAVDEVVLQFWAPQTLRFIVLQYTHTYARN